MKNSSALKRVLLYIKRYRLPVALSLIFAAASVGFMLYAPKIMGKAVDAIIGKGNVDFDAMTKHLIFFGVMIGAYALTQWLMNVCNNFVTYRVVKDVRTTAFNKLQRLDVAYADSHAHGDIVSRIVNDTDQFSDGLLIGFTQFFTSILTILGTIGFMLTINVKVTIAVVCVTPLSLFVASFIAKKTYDMFKRQSQTRGEMTSLVNEMAGNQKTVKAFGYEETAVNRFKEINSSFGKYSLKATFFSSLVNPSTRFVNSMVYACVAIFGGIAVINGSAVGAGITVGQLVCMLTYATQYTKPFNEISGVITELQSALACASRVFELIDTEEQVSDSSLPDLENADGRVQIQNVDFSYDKNKELIKNLNLNVEKSKRVAIVGPTGCGKSTIINLLMRFYDVDSGCIKVSGNDIKDITRKSLRQNYGMVLQETWLKTGTVKENIAYGKPDATDEEIIAAAKLTHAHSFIKRLPNGYDTVIGEEKGNLSQGQKQLLCITRVMLSLPPMLILDEATSSIDTKTEQRIQKTFSKMMEGRTSFIVAHRLSTIKEADIILVMKDGKIIETGTHSQLLAKNGFYTELYNSQFSK
ncbi:MAG: ABC transporter ATP-binding protein/permease [Clostridia bacterium]|nr:ABC transporter ATP-binding protein/permease [Clostridia bacterium]